MNGKPFTIYVVEDNEWLNKLLVYNLSLNLNYQVKGFYSAQEVLKCLDDAPHIITLDYRLPDMDGTEALSKIKAHNPAIEVIVVSGEDDMKTMKELFKQGAYDYIVKDKDVREKLLRVINNIYKNLRRKD